MLSNTIGIMVTVKGKKGSLQEHYSKVTETVKYLSPQIIVREIGEITPLFIFFLALMILE